MATWKGYLKGISGHESSTYRARSGKELGDGFSVGMQGVAEDSKSRGTLERQQGSVQEDRLRKLYFILWARSFTPSVQEPSETADTVCVYVYLHFFFLERGSSFLLSVMGDPWKPLFRSDLVKAMWITLVRWRLVRQSKSGGRGSS